MQRKFRIDAGQARTLRKHMEYQVVARTSRTELSLRVMDLCDRGWRPQGGVAVTVESNDIVWYCQAMVREDDDES